MTQRQVDRYIRTGAPSYKLDAVKIAENGIDKVLLWLDGLSNLDTPLIYSTSTPDAVLRSQNILGLKTATESIEVAMSKIATHARNIGKNKFLII